MQKITTIKILTISSIIAIAVVFGIWDSQKSLVEASSHREAPLIANDPLADNTDLYAFRSPDDTNTVTIIANYVPLQLPQGGPNYASFGENIRYEIHVENNGVNGDDITYRFTFTKTNQDPTTFFNIRLGQQNLKTTYTAEKSVNGGSFTTIVSNGVVPPPNIGPRSISDPTVGLGAANYNALINAAITSATGSGGETIYCGPADDAFFVDLGGIFDLGQTRAGGTGVNEPTDGVACKNIHTIAIKVPISTLQKSGLGVSSAANILDGNFVIGVWASASRQQIRTLSGTGTQSYSGNWIQVSRIGMPLTNEAVIPIGDKDKWNALTPYNEDPAMDDYFCNPELGLYMDNAQFGSAVPAFSALRIQSAAQTVLGNVDFRNGQDGLHVLEGNAALTGTALDPTIFGGYLLRPNRPRSVDLLPIFHTGVPNLAPYQLATGKTDGNPLTNGKPFINNFLPTFGDMLRLNMAVPITPRNSAAFSSLGLIQAAVLGLTDPAYNSNANIQWIPNMDGFPNGRRLEDDVTRIELQAVGGVVLAAIGLWYDDRNIGSSPLTPSLLGALGYTTGVEANDTTFKSTFPYVQTPWEGYGRCGSSLNIAFSNIVNATCNTGGSVKATASGDIAPYTYLWSNGASTATISNLAAGTYTVTVTNANDSATASIILTNTTIATPTGLTTSNITSTSATLSWNAVPGAATYTIRGRKVGSNIWKTVGPVTDTFKDVQSQMSCGKTYEWKVRANCSNGVTSSAYSPTVTFTTNACSNASSKTNGEWDGDFKTFGLSPNPANNLVTLSYTAETETSLVISIIDITGRVVLQQNTFAIQGDNTINLATTQLPKGYYVVEVNDGTTKMHEKLLVVR